MANAEAKSRGNVRENSPTMQNIKQKAKYIRWENCNLVGKETANSNLLDFKCSILELSAFVVKIPNR